MAHHELMECAPSEDRSTARPGVAMVMDAEEAQAVAVWLGHHRGHPAAESVKDALWLRAVLLRSQVGMSPYERGVLRHRADRLLRGILEVRCGLHGSQGG